MRKSSDGCPWLGRVAYGLDRLAATALSIPYKHKIHPHLSDTTLQEYIDKECVLLVASANDGIIPAVHTEALWEHFGRPEVYWSCGGHILYFDKGRVTDRALRFLKDIEVIA